MIKLGLQPKPDRLAEELVKSKTKEFKSNTTQRVWGICKKVDQTLSELKEDIFSSDNTRLPLYAKRLKRLMKEGCHTEEYAALVATTILSAQHFSDIEHFLIVKELWDLEFEDLKEELQFCSLAL